MSIKFINIVIVHCRRSIVLPTRRCNRPGGAGEGCAGRGNALFKKRVTATSCVIYFTFTNCVCLLPKMSFCLRAFYNCITLSQVWLTCHTHCAAHCRTTPHNPSQPFAPLRRITLISELCSWSLMCECTCEYIQKVLPMLSP